MYISIKVIKNIKSYKCSIIIKFQEKFKLKAKTKLHKKCAINNKTEAERNANLDAIRLRHAGVLGLCAFIRAHPYDIPNYLPPVFEHLGLHLNDPQPIPVSIFKKIKTNNYCFSKIY